MVSVTALDYVNGKATKKDRPLREQEFASVWGKREQGNSVGQVMCCDFVCVKKQCGFAHKCIMSFSPNELADTQHDTKFIVHESTLCTHFCF